ncbi:SDR family NAD(P)-dependent oxidoreductase [bacterium]|nr:SDR family NAD(P)-dependent oxidoreductase [bacterium]
MKTIVVTGATKGIGKAICERFAAEGYAVAFCARNKNEVEALGAHLQKLGAPTVLPYSCNVAQKTELMQFAAKCQVDFESIDILVNNAGVFIPGKLSEEEDGILEQMIDTNLYSAYHLTRALLPKLEKSKRPHIFNICSTASIMAYPNGGSYSISKFALLGMTKVLRAEYKNSHLKVTAVMPGATYTASWQGTDLPESRFMQAAEIAEMVHSTYHLPGNAVVEEIVMRPQLGDI